MVNFTHFITMVSFSIIKKATKLHPISIQPRVINKKTVFLNFKTCLVARIDQTRPSWILLRLYGVAVGGARDQLDINLFSVQLRNCNTN